MFSFFIDFVSFVFSDFDVQVDKSVFDKSCSIL